MGQILQNLMSLGRARLIGLGIVGIGILASLLIGLSAAMAPTYRPAYTDLTASSAADIVSVLEQAGFRPRVSADSSVVSLPEESLPRARMAVAQAGLEQDGAPGWELFDSSSGLGMNSFMQRVNRLRALEGELARSIRTIDGVDAARVHLVLAEREAFSRDRPEPSASVVVKFGPGKDMSKREAIAVRNLVASAVPELRADQVTVLSTTGEIILAETPEDDFDAGMQSLQVGIEDRMARNIEAILNARVGAGNARVTVTVDLSKERKVIQDEAFDPDQQVPMSVNTREEQSEGREAGDNPVGVENNIPAALVDNEADQAGSSEASTLTEEVVEYAIGRRQTETVIEPGEVERISVAVLVNGTYSNTGAGTAEYAERSPEELERLTRLVETAIGFNPVRGDAVSIDSMQFAGYGSEFDLASSSSIGDAVKSSIPLAMRLLFGLAVLALVMMAGVRPALARLTAVSEPVPAVAAASLGVAGGQPNEPSATTEADEASAAPPAVPQLPGTVASEAEIQAKSAQPDPEPAGEREYVRLNLVDGAVMKNHLEAVGNLVDQEPDAALSVLRGWLKQAD